MVLTYETAYGDIATLFVLPNGEALCAAWAGDNTGPPPLADVQQFYATLKHEYPARLSPDRAFHRSGNPAGSAGSQCGAQCGSWQCGLAVWRTVWDDGSLWGGFCVCETSCRELGQR